MSTLDEYPNIESVIGNEWFNKIEKHPLKRLLNESPYDREEIKSKWVLYKNAKTSSEQLIYLWQIEILISSSIELEHLESCLSILDLKSYTKAGGSFRRKLRNSDEFYNTFSELEISAWFKIQGIDIEFEPRFPNERNPDFRANIDGKWNYFEVTTPELCQKLKDSVSSIVEVPNRAGGIILEKYETKFLEARKGGYLPKDSPVFLVLNNSHSEVNLNGVDDALHGTHTLHIKLGKNNIQNNAQWFRNRDGLSFTQPHIKNLNGVIVYKREIDLIKERMILRGALQENGFAEVPTGSQAKTTLNKLPEGIDIHDYLKDNK